MTGLQDEDVHALRIIIREALSGYRACMDLDALREYVTRMSVEPVSEIGHALALMYRADEIDCDSGNWFLLDETERMAA
jgi:hypothetical protein